MILLYNLTLLFVGLLKLLIDRRVNGLERRFTRTALAADQMAKELTYKDGNGNQRKDLCATARRQYDLARLVERRDRLEAKYDKWETRSERLGKFRGRVSGWKGRKVPYLVGATDAALAFAGLKAFGVIAPADAKIWIDTLVARL